MDVIDRVKKCSRAIFSLLLLLAMTLPLVIFAQGGGAGGTPPAPQPTGSGTKFTNPLELKTISDFFEAVLQIVVLIGFPIVVLAIMYAGFLLVSARGNEEQLTKGKRALLWAIIGGLIVLGAQVLVTAIGGTVEQLRADALLIPLFS